MVKLTKQQLETLNKTFSWAMNLLEDVAKDNMLLICNENGEFETFDTEKETKEIMDLADYLKDKIEIVEE